MRIVALLHVAEDAVRIVFDYEFHPEALYKVIGKEKQKIRKHLNRFQWETLRSMRVDEGNLYKGEVKKHTLIVIFKYSTMFDFIT